MAKEIAVVELFRIGDVAPSCRSSSHHCAGPSFLCLRVSAVLKCELTYEWNGYDTTSTFVTLFNNGTFTSFNEDGPYSQVGGGRGATVSSTLLWPDGIELPVSAPAHDAYSGVVTANGTISA